MDPTQSEIGKWLTGFFGLAFLPSEVTMWKTVLWKTLCRMHQTTRNVLSSLIT
jgi:hypothetical protein